MALRLYHVYHYLIPDYVDHHVQVKCAPACAGGRAAAHAEDTRGLRHRAAVDCVIADGRSARSVPEGFSHGRQQATTTEPYDREPSRSTRTRYKRAPAADCASNKNMAAKSEMTAHRGAAAGARTKRYTDELGEYWVKQFKQFGGGGANASTSYTGHSSGFRDASVQLPPPPVDAAPPQAVSQASEGLRCESKVRGSSEASRPSDLPHDTCLQQQQHWKQAEISGSNSRGHAAPEHRSVAATPDGKGQAASCSSEQLAPDSANGNNEPAPQQRGSNVIQDGAEAAKLLQHQRLLGAPLVTPLA